MQQGVIPPLRWAEALALLFAQEPQQNQPELISEGLNRLSNTPADAEGLLGIWDYTRVRAAIWIIRGAEGAANIGSPGFLATPPPDNDASAKALFSLAVNWQQAQGIRWSQVLWTGADTAQWGSQLQDAGYVRSASLVYLHRPVATERSPLADLPVPWRWIPAGELPPATVLNLVQATFEQTLDCPFLGEHRTIEQIVSGFKATGDTADRYWQVLMLHDQPAGCLLGSVHHATALLEWTYVGLIPEVRGQGKGRWLCQKGMELARNAGCSDIALAVDGANTPALRLYARHEFSAWDKRDVFVKWSWEQTSPATPS